MTKVEIRYAIDPETAHGFDTHDGNCAFMTGANTDVGQTVVMSNAGVEVHCAALRRGQDIFTANSAKALPPSLAAAHTGLKQAGFHYMCEVLA